jgi:flagella synthesis protein FlgN
MNTHQSSSEHLVKILNDELTLMQNLKLLLELEQSILIENDADKLAGTLQNKNKLLAEINQLEKLRVKSLTQLGINPNAEDFQLFITQNNNLNLQQAWGQLVDLSAQAQELNRNNGMLINRQINRNQQALNILQQNDPHTNTYGADGQTKIGNQTGRGFAAR